MKYKVGDKVRIREDLVLDKIYGGLYCLLGHEKDCGKIFTIEAIDRQNYHLNGSNYWWTEEMFEGVDEMKYKVGDKVRVRKDLVIGRDYGKYDVTEIMSKKCGKTVKIKEVEADFYLLEGCGDYRWTEKMLEEVDEMKETVMRIEIISDGKNVNAISGQKVAVARCHPDDKFDIFTGTRLAIDRLEEKCKPYSWLKSEVRYYVPYWTDDDLFTCRTYNDTECDVRLKNLGLCFKTKEEAIEAAKKMLAVVKEG